MLNVLCLVMALSAQPQVGSPPPESNKGTTPSPALRSDLALAYTRFERALRGQKLSSDRTEKLNKAFDTATTNYFTLQFGEAVRAINQLTRELRTSAGADADPASLLAESVAVRVEPAVLTPENAGAASMTLVGLYAARADWPAAAVVTMTLADDSPATPDVIIKGVRLSAGPDSAVSAVVPFDAAAREMTPGVYSVALSTERGYAVDVGRVVYAERSLDVVRDEFRATISGLPETAELARARAIVAARSESLTDTPSTSNAAQFMIDPLRRAKEVEAELTEIKGGRNPYARRVGDHWRIITRPAPARQIGCRVYAPQQALDGAPLPLVIALHGAGGDENMFPDGYGAGVIKELAEERGFLLACPQTSLMSPEAFDSLLAELSEDYAIDKSRVYVLGHSMGGGFAASLAAKRSGSIAAGCLIAGAVQANGARKSSPLLLIAAQFDAITGTRPTERFADALRKTGSDVELRYAFSYGHTLVVGAKLPEAIEWLLARRLKGD
jgi:predicted esterase